MEVTKQMIDDLFNVITAALDVVANVDPKATELTTKQVTVDVLAKTFDSLKSDIEQYFINSSSGISTPVTQETADEVVAKAKAISASVGANSKADDFENIWSIAQPVLTLIIDTAKTNLPKGSTALEAMITAIDAILAMGTQLSIDLPKLK